MESINDDLFRKMFDASMNVRKLIYENMALICTIKMAVDYIERNKNDWNQECFDGLLKILNTTIDEMEDEENDQS